MRWVLRCGKGIQPEKRTRKKNIHKTFNNGLEVFKTVENPFKLVKLLSSFLTSSSFLFALIALVSADFFSILINFLYKAKYSKFWKSQTILTCFDSTTLSCSERFATVFNNSSILTGALLSFHSLSIHNIFICILSNYSFFFSLNWFNLNFIKAYNSNFNWSRILSEKCRRFVYQIEQSTHILQ